MSSCSDSVYHILILITIRINCRSELSCYREAAKKQDKQACGQIRKQKKTAEIFHPKQVTEDTKILKKTNDAKIWKEKSPILLSEATR